MTGASSRDLKMFPLCDPYPGTIGHAWSRDFVPAFSSGLRTVKDSSGTNLYSQLAATAPRHRLDTEHLDIVKFFPHNKLTEEVYGEQMEKFVVGGRLADGRTKYVYKFEKAIDHPEFHILIPMSLFRWGKLQRLQRVLCVCVYAHVSCMRVGVCGCGSTVTPARDLEKVMSGIGVLGTGGLSVVRRLLRLRDCC